jgi:hypothetical protein
MEKLVYLVWDRLDGDAGEELRDQLLRSTAPELLAGPARAVTVNVHDRAAAEAPSPVPTPAGEDAHVAQLSVWLDCYQHRQPVEDALGRLDRRVTGHLVLESLYDDYGTTPHTGPRDWPDGERSPGVLTVALIHRPSGLGHDEWIERWHGTQSPVSAELQPRTRYVRNEVVRAVTEGAPELGGIVEEAWPSVAHVADPMLFFNADGDPDRMNEHLARMMDSVGACLDLDRLRSTTMSEYLVRSLA